MFSVHYTDGISERSSLELALRTAARAARRTSFAVSVFDGTRLVCQVEALKTRVPEGDTPIARVRFFEDA